MYFRKSQWSTFLLNMKADVNIFPDRKALCQKITSSPERKLCRLCLLVNWRPHGLLHVHDSEADRFAQMCTPLLTESRGKDSSCSNESSQLGSHPMRKMSDIWDSPHFQYLLNFWSYSLKLQHFLSFDSLYCYAENLWKSSQTQVVVPSQALR